MKLKDFAPTTKFITRLQDIFKSKNGKPFAQSFARNLGEALTNKAAADTTNQKILGDAPTQTPQASLTGLLSSGGGQTAAPTMNPGVMTSGITPQAMPTGKKGNSTGGDLMSIMQAMMKQQQGGM